MKTIEYNKILQDDSSFQLVRTNPKLTSNINFTVDIKGNMWLNSMDVNPELTNDMYKKFAIDPAFTHPTNIFRFYDNGQTPPEVAFASVENVDVTKTSKDYKDQFDFDFYFSGARYLPSKEYDEKLSYFAPLYIKKDLPDYFVIFKIEDPMNYKIDISKSKYPFDKEEYMVDFFKKSTLIKTFDLTEGSPVGKYLRNYISDVNFPLSPMTVDFDEDAFTQFNGILMNSGAFGSKSELLDDFYSTASPLKHFEQFMTGGYERNGIIFPNIFNMEFIFDDETSEIYDFNRYVGFYINAIELEKFTTDIPRVYLERASWENTPRLRREIFEYEDVYVKQENSSGVMFPYIDSTLTMSEFEDSFDDKEHFYLNYINDRDGNLYSFKVADDPVTPDVDIFGNELTSGKIKLANTEIDMGRFFGPGRTFMQDDGFSSNVKGFSNSYIKILSEFNQLDSIKFYHPSGTRTDAGGKYDKLTATIGYPLVPEPGDFYFYNDIDDIIGFDTYYFNGTGTPEQIVSAIEGCLKEFTHISYKAITMDEYLFIKVAASGDHDDKFALEFTSDIGIYTTVEIKETTGNDLIGNILTFSGGSKESGNRLIVEAENRDKIEANLPELLVKTENGWSKIRKVSNYVDLVTEKNALTEIGRSKAISDYFDKIALVLDLDETPAISYQECIINLVHRPSFGFLSFFPIRDFDFDFYTSEYLNFPINDLYYLYFIPPDVPLLKPSASGAWSSADYFYEVFGTGTIEFDGTQYSEGGTFKNDTGFYQSYSVISGNPVVSYKAIPWIDLSIIPMPWEIRMDIPINSSTEELQDFEGFFLLKDPSKIVPEENTTAYNRRSKYLNGIARTEYDYYKENDVKDFALISKMIPYITKWSLLNGRDSRNNPYRLNTELVFGFNNFSPSHDDTTQNPSNFTHEWYFLESSFDYTETENTVKLNNSYFEEPIDLVKLLEEEDYFVNYFTYTPTLNSVEVGKTQTRYSIITKNTSGEFETFLKGFKSTFRDVINTNDIGADGKPVFNPSSNRFENYKFSSLLRFVKEDINDPSQPPVRYRFIEHKDFKFILLFIEVVVGDHDAIQPMWFDLWDMTLQACFEVSTDPVIPFSNGFLWDPASPTCQVQLYDSINGDFKINFSTINGENVSDMTYAMLYAIRHKQYNVGYVDSPAITIHNKNYSNIKISDKLDLSKAFLGSLNTIPKMDNLDIPNYPSNLSDEINSFTPSTYIMPRDITTGNDFFIDEFIGVLNPQNISKLESAAPDFITYTEPPVGTSYNLLDTTPQPPLPPLVPAGQFAMGLPSGLPSSIFQNFYIFKGMVSGENYYENLLEKISFARFKEYVNTLNIFIEYESYSLDPGGNPVMAADPKYYLEIPDNETVTKTTGILAVSDENKPSFYSDIDIIGYDYLSTPLDNNYEMNRYKGEYEPIFKDVIFFNSTYKFLDNDIKDLTLANTTFNVNVDEFGEVNDFAHIKISDTKILELEASDSFDPVYELINEIAIGKETYNLFDSNWEYGFHFKYSTKKDFSPVAGTLRIKEDDSFIGKLITLPDEIELENFKVLTLGETDLLDNVNLDEIEIVSKEEGDGIIGFINLNNVLTRYLMETGINQKFNEYLVNQEEYLGAYEDIESYIKEYIKLNILELYELLDLEFYTKLDRKVVSKLQTPKNVNDIEFVFLDDKERFEEGYIINKNLEINKFRRLVLKFNFRKQIKGGMLVSPKVKIKFI